MVKVLDFSNECLFGIMVWLEGWKGWAGVEKRWCRLFADV